MNAIDGTTSLTPTKRGKLQNSFSQQTTKTTQT
jgi:hypothetical protein